jgi:hypothetical protein
VPPPGSRSSMLGAPSSWMGSHPALRRVPWRPTQSRTPRRGRQALVLLEIMTMMMATRWRRRPAKGAPRAQWCSPIPPTRRTRPPRWTSRQEETLQHLPLGTLRRRSTKLAWRPSIALMPTPSGAACGKARGHPMARSRWARPPHHRPEPHPSPVEAGLNVTPRKHHMH